VAFLAKYPNLPADTAAVKRPWMDYLEPPFWYSKVWTSWDADQWRERRWDVVKVVAAADSSAADKAAAQYVCDGTADDIEIQAALDALPPAGGKVVLRQGTYLLDNCVMPKDDTDLEILGTVKVAPATTSRLTADCPLGQNWVTVEDARKFRVGQWLTLIDATKIDHKGGWQNPAGGRKYGECSTIEKIEGNTITLRGKFGSWEEWAKGPQRTPKDYQPGYAVAAQALVTTSHSAILVLGRDRVFIHGPGEIDGNKAQQQPPTAPLSTAYSSEEVLSGCGIAVQDSSFVTVQGLRIHDANLHNVTFHRSENGEIADVEAWGCNDKNILLLNTLRMRVFRNHCHHSVCEDGVCLYLSSHSAMIGGNRVNANPRHGIWINPTCLQETLLPPEALPGGQAQGAGR
ncbi:MAG: right-handed parallel beta-helix repeat-containing protein, partial [Planctomycetes bacterium]|nr:right-handed parallel beta-helix repeat-containing protein [Planctomycetota bacterium]